MCHKCVLWSNTTPLHKPHNTWFARFHHIIHTQIRVYALVGPTTPKKGKGEGKGNGVFTHYKQPQTCLGELKLPQTCLRQ